MGLTYPLISKHLTNQVATSQGHLVHEKQGLQSTRKPPATNEEKMKLIKKKFEALKKKMTKTNSLQDVLIQEIGHDFFPPSTSPNKQSNDVCYSLFHKDEISMAYTDQTGNFPQRSLTGNQYVMVAYHFDANLIWGIPLKDRVGNTLIEAWEKLHNLFK